MAKVSKKSFPIKNIALWSGWYFVASYLIFLALFNFNIVQSSDWAKLSNIVLHGFTGFTFGIALFAWVPIWLAGCITIMQTGKPLKLIVKKDKEKKAAEPEKIEKEEAKIIFPSKLPEEMRVPYSRMIRGQLSRGAMDCKIIPAQSPSVLSAECEQCDKEVQNMTLPESFDIDIKEESSSPVFKELSWDNNDDETEFNKPDENQIEVKIEIRGDKKFAIVTHDDSDFWVADAENWFATGKQKPSPINAVIEIAKNENAIPVLLLKTENIMDLDLLIPKWKANGVKVIKNISEI